MKSKNCVGQTLLSLAARGDCEAAARERRRETPTLEKAEKALLIILSSFSTFTSLYCGGRMVIPKDHVLVIPS